MAKASLFTSPMARKKKVSCHFDPNSYRVISQYAEDIPGGRAKDSRRAPLSENNLLEQPSHLRPDSEHRHNRPNPKNVNFLRHDVRLLNEPVCNVYTSSTADQQDKWWPHRTPKEELSQPSRTLDTTVRDDFQYRGTAVKASGRFSGNMRKSVAKGIVPVNFLHDDNNKQRFWQEGISYEHQYNSRLDPQYPIRAKRHGAFVWDPVPTSEVEKLMKHHNLAAEKGAMEMSQKHHQQHQPQQNTETEKGGATCSLPAVAV